MEVQTLKNQFELKELELNSLLEITQAINNNLAEESLYKIYNFILRANLNIRKLALYVKDEAWSCKVSFGTKKDFRKVGLNKTFLQYREISNLDTCEQCASFEEFDTIVPVAHKDEMLAFVLLSGAKTGDTSYQFGDTNTNFLQALTNIIIVP